MSLLPHASQAPPIYPLVCAENHSNRTVSGIGESLQQTCDVSAVLNCGFNHFKLRHSVIFKAAVGEVVSEPRQRCCMALHKHANSYKL